MSLSARAVVLAVLTLLLAVGATAQDVVTTTADSGAGSLRAVIAAANPGDTVTFSIPTTDPGYDPGRVRTPSL